MPLTSRILSHRKHTRTSMLHIICYVTVKLLFKKDDEMNIEIQPQAADCSGGKRRLTKRSLSFQNNSGYE